jgi:suppressor of ftsI
MADADRSRLEHALISRRQALVLGGTGLAAGVLALRGLSGTRSGATTFATTTTAAPAPTTTTLPKPVDPPVGALLQPPSEIVSSDGVLAATLNAAVTPAVINGATVQGVQTYNGLFPSPTMRIKPGDTFRIKLVNGLTDPTNLHWHGFHVSPEDNSDNVFLSIDPGTTYDYEVAVPTHHHTGLFWYHPHRHMDTDAQVYGGLAGAIVVEGGHAAVDGIAGSRENLVLLKDIALDPTGTQVMQEGDLSAGVLYTVNGQVNPRIESRPGERQLWRVGNLSNQEFFSLALEGHALHIVAIDGMTLPEVWTVKHFELVPGSRVEFVVDAGEPGSYRFRTDGVQLDFTGGNYPEATLATLQVAGDPVTDRPPLPTRLLPLAAIPLRDYRKDTVDKKRVVVFSVKPVPDAAPDFEINGKTFNHHRVDTHVKLDALEQWVIKNTDSSPHPFHIHQNPFQVTKVNGRPVKQPLHWRDTISIPANGSVTIRQQYTDFTGEWVYHCHILFHEDHGMMATVKCTK